MKRIFQDTDWRNRTEPNDSIVEMSLRIGDLVAKMERTQTTPWPDRLFILVSAAGIERTLNYSVVQKE